MQFTYKFLNYPGNSRWVFVVDNAWCHPPACHRLLPLLSRCCSRARRNHLHHPVLQGASASSASQCLVGRWFSLPSRSVFGTVHGTHSICWICRGVPPTNPPKRFKGISTFPGYGGAFLCAEPVTPYPYPLAPDLPDHH